MLFVQPEVFEIFVRLQSELEGDAKTLIQKRKDSESAVCAINLYLDEVKKVQRALSEFMQLAKPGGLQEAFLERAKEQANRYSAVRPARSATPNGHSQEG